MTFLNPLVLFGLLAASLPVLFHLFAQRRARRLEFTSLRFLHKLEKSSMRKVKVRQILLLIIRTLLVIAIVMAFARPALQGYLGGFWGSSHASSTIVILLDNSASISRSDDRGPLLRQAKESAEEIGQLIEESDDAVVLPLASLRGDDGGISRIASRPMLHGRKSLLEAIGKVAIADRPAALDDGLKIASAILARSSNVNKEVYLISDDQARNFHVGPAADSSTRSQADSTRAKLPHGASLRLFDGTTKFYHIPIGGAGTSSLNLAIDSLKPTTTIYEPGRPVDFAAWIRNTSDADASNVVISLFYNDERVAQQSIPHIAAHSSERVSITGPTRSSGIVSVRAELEPDALQFDNSRYAVITIPASRHLAVYAQNPASATFVQLALSQTLSTSNTAPFTVELHALNELRSVSSIADRLDGVFVFLGGAPLAAEDAQGLGAYVRSGHGAGIFLMPGLEPAAYNGTFSKLAGLPIVRAKAGSAGDNSTYSSFSKIESIDPFFAGMFDEGTKSVTDRALGIESPRFYEYYTLQPPYGTPLISLSSATPFLSEIQIGKGTVLLFTAPPTLDFSDFPKKSIFLPLIRRTAAFTSAVHAHVDENVQSQFVTTEPFDVVLPESRGVQTGASLLVKLPTTASPDQHSAPDETVALRTSVVVDAEGRPRIHVGGAGVAGNYYVYQDAEARDPIAAFAVNIQSDESDLHQASGAEIERVLSSTMAQPKNFASLDPGKKDLAERVVRSRYGVELWQAFLGAALLLAVAEMLIAREARRQER